MYEPLDEVSALLRAQGYRIEDPWDVVEAFESKVAAYAGSAHAVSVDNCTDGLFLCLKYLDATGEVTLPARTYLSVPQAVVHAGCTPRFTPSEWAGVYRLDPYPVVDGATRFTAGMYIAGTYQCLSFHHRKTLAIGKGGMILTDDAEAAQWFRLAAYEGRPRRLPFGEMPEPAVCGWNMYMPPEQAARGIQLFERLPEHNEDCGGSWRYPDVSSYAIWPRSAAAENRVNRVKEVAP